MAGGIIGNLMYAVGFKVNTRGLNEADSKMSTLRKSVVGLGLAASVAAAGIGIAGINAASDFEKSMSHIQMATGAAAEQMEETRDIAKNLYSQNFGEDWQDLGSSIASVAQITGQTGAELENTTRNALLLRDAFGIEVNESARAAKTMMENFGISSEEAFNLIAQGSQKGLDFSGELIDTINEYSLQFKSLGFDANEMFDTLAAGSAEGAFNLDKVADAVKEFNIRSKDAGDKGAVEAFEMLGLNADQMMRTFAAGGPAAKQAFTQITQMIGDIEDPVAQNTVAVGLFGTQFEDLQKDVITAMGYVDSQFDMTKGSMEELNKIKFNKPGEAFSMFGRQLETGILIPIGEKLLPFLNQFGQWLADHRPQIEAFGNAIGDAIGGAITFVTEKAKEVYEFMTSNWEGIKETVIGLGAAMIALKGTFIAMKVIKTINVLMAAFRAGTLIATAAQLGLNVAMLANPMTWIAVGIAAVIAGIVLLIRHWDKVKAVMGRVWNWIKSVFGGIGNWFKTRFTEAYNGIVSAFGRIGAWFRGNWEATKAVFAGVGTWFSGIFTQAYQGVVNAFGAVRGWFGSIWEGIKSIWSGVTTWFGSLFSGAYESIKTAFGGVKDWFGSLWDGIKAGFTSFINMMIAGINTLINGLNKIQVSLPDWAGGQSFGINIPNIPMLAKGGIATGPTLAMIGEGAESEAVLPLSKLESMLQQPRYPQETRLQPAAAPARYAPAAASLPPIEIHINVPPGSGGGGSSSAEQTAQIIAAEVRRQVQEILESAGRILNVQGAAIHGNN